MATVPNKGIHSLMDIFTLLISNLFPLYILIGLGYIAGRFMDVNVASVAKILIFILMPFVAFGAVAKIDFQAEYLLLPVFVVGISIATANISHIVAGRLFTGKYPSLIGMASATGNTGYFGLPLIIAILGEEAAGIYLIMNFGVVMSEITLAYYIGARGNNSVLESIKKVLALPVLYAILLGLVANQTIADDLPPVFDQYWHHATGAWIILGMMLIGVALGKLPRLELNVKLLSYLSVVKFIIWPLAMLGLIMLDINVMHLFDAQIYTMFVIIGVVPLAGNIVAYAAELDVHPEEAAMTVLLSTFFALLYIPLVFFILPFP